MSVNGVDTTGAGPFRHLLAPGRIGTMQLRNRIVMSPMETLYGTPEGLPSARTVAYFAARAAGGVGLITLGATGIDPQHPETPGGLHIGSDDAVDAHRRLVDAVHERGARIQPQVVHAGPDGLGPEMHGVTSLGPSVIPSYLTGRPSEAITLEQWHQVLDLYRRAVVRIREAGYDGLELHAAHGYMLLGSFLAPQRNRRTDDYRGDTVEGRWRAVLEALAAIRGEVGDDFPVTLRVSGHERVAAGRPMDELARMAPRLVAAGVDAFHVSGGVIDRLVTRMVNGSDDGDGLNVGAAAAVKETVDVPVIAVGRLHDPAHAERVLAEGRADLVALARPLLADPDLPAKLASGTASRVRQCISCQNCIDAMEIRFSVDCAVSPTTGRELELAAPTDGGRGARGEGRATSLETPQRHVVVIGAGPAGLEAARRAALDGFRVTLLERSDTLGGAFVAASRVHPENAPFLRWLRDEVALADIDVRLGVDATAPAVADLGPDAVLVATGGRRDPAPLEGDDLPHVTSMLAPVAGDRQQRVAVVGGSLSALEVAEVHARAGHRVAVFEASERLAPEVGGKRLGEHLLRLDRLAVTVHTGAAVVRAVPEGLEWTPVGGTTRTFAASHVLLADDVRPDLRLHEQLTAALPGVPVTPIGDCTGLGLLQGATLDAARAVAALR